RHLVGELTEEEFHDRLRQRGHLLPAPVLELPEPRPMPPMRWRLEWEQRLAELAAEAGPEGSDDESSVQAATAIVQPAPPIATSTVVARVTAGGDTAANASGPPMEIHTLGETRIVI